MRVCNRHSTVLTSKNNFMRFNLIHLCECVCILYCISEPFVFSGYK